MRARGLFGRATLARRGPQLSYRQAEIYGAQETLLITQHGFTEGRTIFPAVVTKEGSQPKYADPGRLASLGDFYARIANSDVVETRRRSSVVCPQGRSLRRRWSPTRWATPTHCRVS